MTYYEHIAIRGFVLHKLLQSSVVSKAPRILWWEVTCRMNSK